MLIYKLLFCKEGFRGILPVSDRFTFDKFKQLKTTKVSETFVVSTYQTGYIL
jgi:hypothetical protein